MATSPEVRTLWKGVALFPHLHVGTVPPHTWEACKLDSEGQGVPLYLLTPVPASRVPFSESFSRRPGLCSQRTLPRRRLPRQLTLRLPMAHGTLFLYTYAPQVAFLPKPKGNRKAPSLALESFPLCLNTNTLIWQDAEDQEKSRNCRVRFPAHVSVSTRYS